jgi:hypothetical protein
MDVDPPEVQAALKPLPFFRVNVPTKEQTLEAAKFAGVLAKFGAPLADKAPDLLSLFGRSPTPATDVSTTTSTTQIQQCNPPVTRAFEVVCAAADACTPVSQLKKSVKLEVVHITNRNQFAGSKEASLFAQAPIGIQVDAPIPRSTGSPFDSLFTSLGKATDATAGSALSPDLLKAFFPFGTTAPSSAALRPQATAADLSRDLGLLVKGADASTSTSTTISQGTLLPGFGGIEIGQRSNGLLDDKSRLLLGGGADTVALKKGVAVDALTALGQLTSQQCGSATDYVDVECGSIVAITLDREDACLSNSYKPVTTFAEERTFTTEEFAPVFGDTQFVLNEGTKGLAVRGTSVRLVVQAEDACTLKAAAVLDPTQECEFRVAGRCCSPVAAPARVENNVLTHTQTVNRLI